MPRRSHQLRDRLLALVPLVALLALLPAVAGAHEGDARYRSQIAGLRPDVAGVRVEVLNYDDRLELVNRSDGDVVIEGYEREPYARVDADGTVAINRNSPASYLNDDRYAQAGVPAAVREDPHAAPDWEVQDRTGRFEWHDHRMHWMARGIAPQVRDESARTKIFDWVVPLEVGGRPVAVAGTLWWVGEQGGGFPVAAVAALVVLALLAVLAVVLVRRRRAAGGPGEGDGSGRVAERTASRDAW